MLSANLLRQAGIPCCSYRWGCSNTDHDPCGDGGPRRGRSDPQACRYPPVHPTSELSRRPASAARAPPRLSTPGRCPPLPARTFLGRCTEILSFPPVTGSASGPGSARGKQWIGPTSCARALCLHRQFPPQQTERGCPGVIPAFRWLRIEGKLVTARIQSARPTWAAWRGEGVQVGGEEEEEEELWPPFLCGTWRSGSRERETCLITGQTIVSRAI